MTELLAGRPSLIIAGRLGATAHCHCRACRTVGSGRTRHIGAVRLFPLARLVIDLGRRRIHSVVQPTMPSRRHTARFGKTVVNDPAPLEAKCGINLATARPEIAIAALIRSHELAVSTRP